MKVGSGRSARAAVAALLVQLPCSPLVAQTALPLPRVHSPGFGGGALFVSPYAAAELGPFDARAELEVTWGESSARDGTASLAVPLPAELRLSGAWTATSAAAASERRSDQSLGVTLERGRTAITVARRRSHAVSDDYTSELTGLDVRLGAGLGTALDLEIGLIRRSSTVVEHGDIEVERRIVVAGYEFLSVRRLQYLEAARHQDFEFEISATCGPVRLSGLVGRGLSDGEAPDRSWAFGRLAAPVARRLEILAEAGRNGGVPAIGRVPQNFARLGLRLNLSRPDDEPPPRSLPYDHEAAAVASIELTPDEPRLLISAPGASAIDVRGDFTAWTAVPMTRLPDGRWFIPVKEGLLHFNIRLDGRAWSVPAGVPVVPDEFSGAPVAVVVVGGH